MSAIKRYGRAQPTHFKNFPGWAERLPGWAEPTPDAANKNVTENLLSLYYVRCDQIT